jgi:hypothetical protein
MTKTALVRALVAGSMGVAMTLSGQGLSARADAQWDRRVPTSTPLDSNGEPDLEAPTPRTADLSGVWETYSEARGDFPQLLIDLSSGLEPGAVPRTWSGGRTATSHDERAPAAVATSEARGATARGGGAPRAVTNGVPI